MFIYIITFLGLVILSVINLSTFPFFLTFLQILAEGYDVFSGVIYDNKGRARCKDNQTIRDEVLLEHFDWYVEGVEFYEE